MFNIIDRFFKAASKPPRRPKFNRFDLIETAGREEYELPLELFWMPGA